MSKHVILIAQPRSGGVMTSQLLESKFGYKNRFEYFNTHRYGYDAKFENELDAKIHLVDTLRHGDNSIIKVSWFDVCDIFDKLVELEDITWYHLHRTNPTEMMCSSYMSYLTGIFHVNRGENIKLVNSVTIPSNFVIDYFDKNNPGGWWYNCVNNIPIIQTIDCTQITYDDATTPADMSMTLFGKDYSRAVTATKLYKSKRSLVTNYTEIDNLTRMILKEHPY
jgi:hypothetical protein